MLVGGAAVELYTEGAYTTGDFDFVGEVPSAVAAELRRCGFVKHGRHWLHETGQLFLEFPGSRLEPYAEPVHLEIGGSVVLAVAPEALLADRLAAWKFWRSDVDGANALLLYRAARGDWDARLAARMARQLEVEDERRRLVRFARQLGRGKLTATDVRRWLERGR